MHVGLIFMLVWFLAFIARRVCDNILEACFFVFELMQGNRENSRVRGVPSSASSNPDRVVSRIKDTGGSTNEKF